MPQNIAVSLPVGVVVQDIAVDVGSFGFYYCAGRIVQSVNNGSPPLRRFFGAGDAEMDSATRYTLPRSTASIMKI